MRTLFNHRQHKVLLTTLILSLMFFAISFTITRNIYATPYIEIKINEGKIISNNRLENFLTLKALRLLEIEKICQNQQRQKEIIVKMQPVQKISNNNNHQRPMYNSSRIIIHTQQKETPSINNQSINNYKVNLGIIIADVSKDNIDNIIKVLGDYPKINLAINPYNYETMKKARIAGFQVVTNITMEPFNTDISLPKDAITTKNSNAKNVKILKKLLSNSFAPIAIINEMGSKITDKEYANKMIPLFEVLKEKNIGFVDSRSNPSSVASKIAREQGVKATSNYMYLNQKHACSDKSCEQSPTCSSMAKLAMTAYKTKKELVGIGNYSPAFAKDLKSWLDRNVTTYQRVEILPISEILK